MSKHRRVIDAEYYEADDRPRRVNRESRPSRNDINDRENNSSNNNSSNNNLGLDLGNIDFSQIAGLLQNVDMNQLSSILSGFAGASRNVNSEHGASQPGLGDLSGILNGLGGIGGLSGILNSIGGIGGLSGILNSMGGIGGLSGLLGNLGGLGKAYESNQGLDNNNAFSYTGDRRVDLLNALRTMVTPERANIIELIIQVYTLSRILKR